MKTVTLEIDDETYERVCRMASERGGTTEGLMGAFIRALSGREVHDPIWGTWRDDPEMGEVMDEIVKDRYR